MSDPDFLSFNCNKVTREDAGKVIYDQECSEHKAWSHPKITAYPIRYVTDGKGKRRAQVFDFDERKYRNPHGLNKADRRRFQRLQTGLQIGVNKRAPMRFLTLTTAKGVKRDICKDLDILKKRILRAFGWKFNKYYKLKTREGPEKQVLHIVFWGKFIPKAWLSKVWREIHGSPIVDIRAIKRKSGSLSGLAYYLITNYFKKQPVDRMSCGWGWAWLGVCRSWKNTILAYGNLRFPAGCGDLGDRVRFPERFKFKNILSVWRWRLLDPLVTSRQIRFCNPERSIYQVKFGKGEIYWFNSWFSKPHKLVKASPRIEQPKTVQSVFFRLSPANDRWVLRWNNQGL
jgi:hypothetical protein